MNWTATCDNDAKADNDSNKYSDDECHNVVEDMHGRVRLYVT